MYSGNGKDPTVPHKIDPRKGIRSCVSKDDGVMCSWSIVAADMNKKVADELIK